MECSFTNYLWGCLLHLIQVSIPASIQKGPPYPPHLKQTPLHTHSHYHHPFILLWFSLQASVSDIHYLSICIHTFTVFSPHKATISPISSIHLEHTGVQQLFVKWVRSKCYLSSSFCEWETWDPDKTRAWQRKCFFLVKTGIVFFYGAKPFEIFLKYFD